MRKQVEALEHETDAAALDGELALGRFLPAARDGNAADRPAVDVDDAGARQFEMIDAAQQRGLAGPGGADDDDCLAIADVEVDIAQHGLRAEGLGQPSDAQRR